MLSVFFSKFPARFLSEGVHGIAGWMKRKPRSRPGRLSLTAHWEDGESWIWDLYFPEGAVHYENIPERENKQVCFGRL